MSSGLTERAASVRLGACAALSFLTLGGAAEASPPPAMAPEDQRIDLVRVDKSDRLMLLLRDGEIVRTYAVALGPNPLGHKRREGDGRTPVGRYVLDWRNPASNFHRSLHVSYPNVYDRIDAEERGVDPGGLIMIHGDASSRDLLGQLDTEGDWTDGCIAVTDAEMDEIWSLTPDGTVIEIRD